MKATRLKHLPNILTFCNMVIGIVVVCSMKHSNTIISIKTSCYLIYIAVVFDFLDGCLARFLNASSEMGKQLDSFADFATFGIAPIAIFIAQNTHLPWYLMLILALYPIAGVFRLARYNLQDYSHYIIGLPITVAGFILTTVTIINSYISTDSTVIYTTIYLILIVILSLMMVSCIRVKRIG
ncbi:MAG: hypothetical protein GX967_05615 [Clostridiales bacterium]|nr:hypothetical protein [Clostridiales bacterium]